MGAKELIFLISLGLSVCVVLSTPKRTLTYYDTDEKYTCVKKLDIFLDHGIIFKYNQNFLKTWPGNAEFKCQTSMYSKTLNTGIIGVIQKMNFRKKTDCLDYIHFSEGNAKKCGEMVLGTTLTREGALLPPPAFISDFKGPFTKVSTYDVNNIQGHMPYITTLSERTNLIVAGAVVQPQRIFTFLTRVDPARLSPGDVVELEIAFTAYKDCEDFNNSEELFNCGYGVCILSIFVNDGVVNCPFGDCRDEGDCDQALESLSVMEDERGATNISQPGKRPGITAPSIGNFTGISHRNIHTRWEGHTKYAQQTLEEVKSIGSAFEKHNVILERMSGIFESAVHILKEKDKHKIN